MCYWPDFFTIPVFPHMMWGFFLPRIRPVNRLFILRLPMLPL
nr:MAG TPA: hypothetical protein [Caudoviricetes sp.]